MFMIVNAKLYKGFFIFDVLFLLSFKKEVIKKWFFIHFNTLLLSLPLPQSHNPIQLV